MSTNPSDNSYNVIKSFQLTTDSASKLDYDYGKKIAQYIENTISGTTSYYYLRNDRFRKNRDWANGRVDVQAKFADRFEMNGKQNFLNLAWKAPMLVNTICSRLVGRWMGNNEKIIVTATDPLSVDDKKQEYKNADFILYNKDMLSHLQEQSGVPIVSQNQFIPEDQDELDLWVAEYQRLPEEILFERGANDVLASNGLFDAIKEKLLHDSAQVGFVGTYTWMDDAGVIHTEWVEPENAIYSYSRYPDFRDTTWRGQVKALKISELRREYGKEFGGKLTEEEIWVIAQKSKEYQYSDKLTWLWDWNFALLRPYDEWNVDVIYFEFKSLDSDPYTLTEKFNGSRTHVTKGWPVNSNGNKKEKLGENQELVEDTKWNIYEGAYVRSDTTMLSWGLKTNMIRPQDPKELGDAEFSYSFYMYQNQGMRNLAIPEKIEEPIEGMTLARLKIQQVVAKMKPPGAKINIDSMQELDLGLANLSKPLDVEKIWLQTGNLYYRGRDADGNPIPAPIEETANIAFASQIQALNALYDAHYQRLKDELGEDPNLISAASKPRVTEGNIQVSQQQAADATGYMYDAYLYVLEDTAKKIACLLTASVTFGASAYRHLMKENDVKGRVFSSRIQALPTEQEVAKLEGLINQSILSNPDFVMYIDPFKIMRIAKEDVKLGELYYKQAMKRMLKSKAEQAAQNSQSNADAQSQSLQDKAKADAILKMLDMQREKLISDTQSRNAVLAWFGPMYAAGTPIPPELKELEAIMIQKVALPAMMQNQQDQQALIQQAQQQMSGQPQQGMPTDQSQQQQQGQPPQTDQNSQAA